jgi:hypothetical protein
VREKSISSRLLILSSERYAESKKTLTLFQFKTTLYKKNPVMFQWPLIDLAAKLMELRIRRRKFKKHSKEQRTREITMKNLVPVREQEIDMPQKQELLKWTEYRVKRMIFKRRVLERLKGECQ